MGPIKATANCLTKPFTWSGRATRSEYWWFQLFYWLAYAGLLLALFLPEFAKLLPLLENPSEETAAAVLASFSQSKVWVFNILTLWLVFSAWAVMIRRLHDIGFSAWWQFIGLVPLLGGLFLLGCMIWPSNAGPNRFDRDAGPARPEPQRSAWTAVPEAGARRPRLTQDDLRALRHARMPGASGAAPAIG